MTNLEKEYPREGREGPIKPKVLTKIVAYTHKCQAAGKNVAVRGFQISYRSMCNFRCSHCYVASSPGAAADTLTLEDVRKVAGEFDELQAWEVGIQGGEPLLFPDLAELIEAVDPSRFYVCLITNGFLMTDEVAARLARLGVDRVAVSIDGFSEAEHDTIRNKKGSFARCLRALECVRRAGMTPAINMVVGHHNVASPGFEEFVRFAQANRYQIVVNPATPTGAWKNKLEIMLTEADSAALLGMRARYPVLMRDLWDFSETRKTAVWGDPSGNLYFISSRGDIFPHPYIFISLGNVRTTSAGEAARKAWRVRYFRDKSDKSLAGEDRGFVERFLSREMSVLHPLRYEDAFSSGDLYPDGGDEIIRTSVGSGGSDRGARLPPHHDGRN